MFYVARRLVGRERAWDAVRALLDQLHVVSVGAAELKAASTAAGDFEDRVQAACAAAAAIDFIVTRDPTGFAGSRVAAVEPSVALARIASAS